MTHLDAQRRALDKSSLQRQGFPRGVSLRDPSPPPKVYRMAIASEETGSKETEALREAMIHSSLLLMQYVRDSPQAQAEVFRELGTLLTCLCDPAPRSPLQSDRVQAGEGVGPTDWVPNQS